MDAILDQVAKNTTGGVDFYENENGREVRVTLHGGAVASKMVWEDADGVG